MSKFHPKLSSLIETIEMSQVVLECQTTLQKLFFKEVSEQYDIIDTLSQELIDIKKTLR